MESSKPEEDENKEGNIIKDATNIFRLNRIEKETNDAVIKGIKKLSTALRCRSF